VANLPSETWVGMSSLLPAPDARLEVHEGKPVLYSESAQGDLCFRAARWKLLEEVGAECLGKDKKGNRRDELHHLHDLGDKPVHLPNLLVLFARDVDQAGHVSQKDIIRHLEKALSDIEHAIRKLQRWGYAEIHIVTDHGFVILNSAANVQPFEVDKRRFALLTPRWGLVGPDDPPYATGLPFALDARWQVAVAPGLRSFSEPGTFFHGGATLQEVVIPHLKIVTAVAPRRMRAAVQLPQNEIVTLSVRIDLLPETPPPRDLFDSQVQALEVRVFLGAPAQPLSSEKTVRIEPEATQAISVTVFLRRETPIPAGTLMPVQVIDVASEENLAAGLCVRAARDLE
jgi:biotin operon repressor